MVAAEGKNSLIKHCPSSILAQRGKINLGSSSAKKDPKEKLTISTEGQVGSLPWAHLCWTSSSLFPNGIY